MMGPGKIAQFKRKSEKICKEIFMCFRITLFFTNQSDRVCEID